jgi:hypothetical protein
MKTERRHELQHNVLADSLERWIEAMKPYSRAVLAGVIGAVVLFAVWGYMANQSRERAAAAWNEYYAALAPTSTDPREALSSLVSRFPGTPVGQAARAVLADIQLDDGTTRLFMDKSAGRDELQKAAEMYQALLLEADEPSMLARATFGLARAHEALGKDLPRAVDEYRSIARKWPNSPYVDEAEARAKSLESDETKSFYDWFAKYERPKPVANELGVPGARPDFMKDPLEEGGFKVPPLDKSILPQLTTEKDDEAASPASEGNQPAENGAAPAPEQPATPAESDAPKAEAATEPAPQSESEKPAGETPPEAK